MQNANSNSLDLKKLADVFCQDEKTTLMAFRSVADSKGAQAELLRLLQDKLPRLITSIVWHPAQANWCVFLSF